jgi:hypothetical protein
MQVIKELKTYASGVALTNEEVQTLVSAQKIVNKIWDELEEADEVSGNAAKIYNDTDEIGYSLESIANLVDIED